MIVERRMAMNLGAPEIILIMIVMFFFFGANKIPELMKGLGTGLREFKKAARDIQNDIEKDVKPIDTKKSDEVLRKQMRHPNTPCS